jgi:hypothetical protein
MAITIVVAGGTGNLGGKIIDALLDKGAVIHAPVRFSSDHEKIEKLWQQGVKVLQVDMNNVGELTKACTGAACVVSALQGLRDVIVDTQSVLLDAAVAAGVPRFIPSDYALDFTVLPVGQNRNFDLRREFHQRLYGAQISPTSIYNGAFADILSYNTPMLDLRSKRVGYWGENADWNLDFTTVEDTAAFTAAAAVDASAPRKLCIASFQISPKQLQSLASELSGTPFSLIPMGSLEGFAAYNKKERAAHPEGEQELYPNWQRGQYMHDQFSTHHEGLNNDRYPDISWTSAREVISSLLFAGSREGVTQV